MGLPGGGVACCTWDADAVRAKAAGAPGSCWQAASCGRGIKASCLHFLWNNWSSVRCGSLSELSWISWLWLSAAAMRLRTLGLPECRWALARPNVALTSCRVTFTWWPLPDFKNNFWVELSSVSTWVSTQKLCPERGFVLLSFTFGSRTTFLAVSLWSLTESLSG